MMTMSIRECVLLSDSGRRHAADSLCATHPNICFYIRRTSNRRICIPVHSSSSSRMRVMNHNWPAMKQRLHMHCAAEISRQSALSETGFDNGTSSGSRRNDTCRSVSASCHFLLQAPQCPYSVWKRFSRDHCCRGRSKPDCRIVGSHTSWPPEPTSSYAFIPLKGRDRLKCTEKSTWSRCFLTKD